jgi:hypothetical protein
MKCEKDKRRMNYEELKWIMCFVIKCLIQSMFVLIHDKCTGEK